MEKGHCDSGAKDTTPSYYSTTHPISLTCFFAKIFQDFVVKWIMNDIGNSLDNNQFGSLKGSSTTHCLVKLLNDVGRETDKLNRSGVIMATDFSKAFDRVNHLYVVEKFISLGVRPSIIPWICDF